jgi:hypothetical protein
VAPICPTVSKRDERERKNKEKRERERKNKRREGEKRRRGEKRGDIFIQQRALVYDQQILDNFAIDVHITRLVHCWRHHHLQFLGNHYITNEEREERKGKERGKYLHVHPCL